MAGPHVVSVAVFQKLLREQSFKSGNCTYKYWERRPVEAVYCLHKKFRLVDSYSKHMAFILFRLFNRAVSRVVSYKQ